MPHTITASMAKAIALSPCLQPLGIRWAPTNRGPPCQNLAEGDFSIQRWMVDAYVSGGTDRESGYRRHASFVQADQLRGHSVHTRTEAERRIYHLPPED